MCGGTSLHDDADTVCRAMGYTHAVKNSVMTATQCQLTLNWTFHNLNKMQGVGWVGQEVGLGEWMGAWH